MKIKIATDSTADIPEEFCEKLNISVLPLTILHDYKEYKDGIDMKPSDIYEILDSPGKIPVSSQVSLPLYTQLYEETWKSGYTDLIQVTLNSKGSGTYQAAVLAREIFFENHQHAKEEFAIHIIDSKTYSMAYGIPIIEAAQMIQDGAAADEVISHIEEWLEHTRPMFVPLDLKCVKKSGRISPAAAFVGDALGLKPLITFEDGEAKIISKARGEAKAFSMLLDICMKERKPDSNYAIVYGKNEDAHQKLRESCAKVMDKPPIAEYQVGCVIAINTGPNMVGILYRT